MGDFDVVVLGGGTAGVRVATTAARGGKKTALIEAGLIGGESPYLACLPSKSLLVSAARGETWEQAIARRDEVTGGLDDSAVLGALASAGVSVIRGTGTVTAAGTVSVAPLGAGSPEVLRYTDLVIASGSEPVAPPIEGLPDIPAWTTAEALCSPDLPRRLIVLGGGPAGCELAQVYAAFGSHVTLVEASGRLLPDEPAFTGEILARALRRSGVDVRCGSPAAKAERTADGLTLGLADGTRIDANRLLLATGRRPRVSGLGLDALGIAVEPGAALPTTTTCQVADAGGHVWAAGDVTGVGHTHSAAYQADIVAANLCSTGASREADYSAIPRTVLTTPSVFAVGVSGGGPGLVVAGADLAGTARARIDGDLGRVELYADPKAGVLAGAAAVGPDAASWMAEVTLAIRARVPIAILADVVHGFPGYGEAVEAALRQLTAGHSGTKREVSHVSEMDMETPEDDALEQHQEVVEDEETRARTRPRDISFDVDEADAAEQERSVGFDDDDYR
ncbi:MAG TPA: NAD(P)/FAD-dependent oxidoreductase [Streptosporangiaceae bacterium]|nr:NAD(P)/FAD-dependent oxidoreductase [Streptosporangiaceae bacterium]